MLFSLCFCSVSVCFGYVFLLFNFDCVREAELKPMCEFACVCRFSR